MTDYRAKLLARQLGNLWLFLGGVATFVAALGSGVPTWLRLAAGAFAAGSIAVKVGQSHSDAKARANGGNGNGNGH